MQSESVVGELAGEGAAGARESTSMSVAGHSGGAGDDRSLPSAIAVRSKYGLTNKEWVRQFKLRDRNWKEELQKRIGPLRRLSDLTYSQQVDFRSSLRTGYFWSFDEEQHDLMVSKKKQRKQRKQMIKMGMYEVEECGSNDDGEFDSEDDGDFGSNDDEEYGANEEEPQQKQEVEQEQQQQDSEFQEGEIDIELADHFEDDCSLPSTIAYELEDVAGHEDQAILVNPGEGSIDGDEVSSSAGESVFELPSAGSPMPNEIDQEPPAELGRNIPGLSGRAMVMQKTTDVDFVKALFKIGHLVTLSTTWTVAASVPDHIRGIEEVSFSYL